MREAKEVFALLEYVQQIMSDDLFSIPADRHKREFTVRRTTSTIVSDVVTMQFLCDGGGFGVALEDGKYDLIEYEWTAEIVDEVVTMLWGVRKNDYLWRKANRTSPP